MLLSGSSSLYSETLAGSEKRLRRSGGWPIVLNLMEEKRGACGVDTEDEGVRVEDIFWY